MVLLSVVHYNLVCIYTSIDLLSDVMPLSTYTSSDISCIISMQEGSNAFHLCIEGGHLAIAQYLAPKMKDHLNDANDEGDTALHIAVRKGQLSMVEYLVGSCGLDVTVRDKVGNDVITLWMHSQVVSQLQEVLYLARHSISSKSRLAYCKWMISDCNLCNFILPQFNHASTD